MLMLVKSVKFLRLPTLSSFPTGKALPPWDELVTILSFSWFALSIRTALFVRGPKKHKPFNYLELVPDIHGSIRSIDLYQNESVHLFSLDLSIFDNSFLILRDEFRSDYSSLSPKNALMLLYTCPTLLSSICTLSSL